MKEKYSSFISEHTAEYVLIPQLTDVLGVACEYLIGQFASGAEKKAGEFYTPQQVSMVLAKLVTQTKN